MPLQPRHDYAADLHRGLPASDIDQPRSSPRRRMDARCYPAQICQIRAGGLLLRSFQTPVSHVHLPISLAGPKPSGSTGPSRRCRGCYPPSLVSPRSGCPQLRAARCDEPRAVSFHHRTVQSASWRSISATHSTFGASGLNFRSTRSSATRTPGTRIVVRPFLTFTSPEIPASHEPADPFARDDDVQAEAKLGLNPPGAIDAACVLVDLGDPRGQPRIAQRPVGRRAALPGMKPRFGDPEDLAHHRDWETGPLRRDDPVGAHRVSVSAAKRTAARSRMSRSCSTRLTRLRSSRSSTHSTLVSPSSRSRRSSW
jgi:hypothetical protein